MGGVTTRIGAWATALALGGGWLYYDIRQEQLRTAGETSDTFSQAEADAWNASIKAQHPKAKLRAENKWKPKQPEQEAK